ncbi:uncharacterized protein LOC131963172 [Centropristis striata]|uniref:uncharacterized protein LOC131963172 n=1 Tax=Centropristis striata TaxID=184440 RepID=UPI0027DECE80|nr:uncharacterized protein LOC131963172 [Centropristis striata]
MDKLPLNMDYKIPEDELGDLRCSDLDVPMFQTFIGTVSGYVRTIQQHGWKLISEGKLDSETTKNSVLFKLCQVLLELITDEVFVEVVPQIRSRMDAKMEEEDDINDTLQSERNYFSVSEEDILASLGSSFHRSFGAESPTPSKHVEKLQELLATQVAKRVNQAIYLIWPSSPPQPSQQSQISVDSPSSYESPIEEMAYCVSRILREIMGIKEPSPETPDDQESQVSELSELSSPDQENCIKVQDTDYEDQEMDYGGLEMDAEDPEMDAEDPEMDAEDQEMDAEDPEMDAEDQETDAEDPDPEDQDPEDQDTDAEDQDTDAEDTDAEDTDAEDQETDTKAQENSTKDQKMDDLDQELEVLYLEDPEGCTHLELEIEEIRAESPNGSSPDQDIHHPASSAEALIQRDRAFLCKFLLKLMNHIACPFRYCMFDEGISELVERLRKKIVGKVTLPKASGKIHIPIIEKLDQEFGSRTRLRDAMMSNEDDREVFEEALGEALTAQLLLQKQNLSFGAKIKRFFCGKSKRVSPACAKVSQENTCLQKGPAISRMLSSMAKCLKNCLPCCSRSED